MRVIDFIDFKSITSVLNKNPTMQHLFLSVTDPDGNMLSSAGWKRVCKQFHRSDKITCENCRKSDTILANRFRNNEKYTVYTCYNNLTEASAPFFAAGENIGNLIVGQVFLKAPDLDMFAKKAEDNGFDKEDYIRAIKEVPVVDETEFRYIMDFFSELTALLVNMAFRAYKYKELSDRLMIRTEELEYVNSELESFSYSVSHDLRAPLRHIMGFIELFNKKYSGSIPDQGKHYFDVIYSSTKNMSVLIDELLKFCRNGRAEITKADVDMDEVVKELLMSIKEDAGDRSICWNVDRLAPARCDKEMFKLVWQNLIENAVKFTGKKPEAVIEIGCCEENGRPVYFIKDNGAGFDMRYSQKLFGVFQRMHSKDEFDGTGIGLATAKRIISRHGGKIWAEAATDKGAAFYFNIPGEGETQKDEF